MANRRQMPGDKQIQRTFDNMSTERKVEQAGQGVSSILKANRPLPGSIDVDKFIASRAFEIYGMKRAQKQASADMTTRAFQSLPRHLRRRAASHNPRRVPKRLRDKATFEIDKGDKTVKMQRKKADKRRKNGIKGMSVTDRWLGRQQSKRWLETHVWHAKRCKMITRWAYRLASTPTAKCHRPAHRAAHNGCIIGDVSFYAIVQLEGTVGDLRGALSGVVGGNGWGGSRYESGARMGKTMLHHYKQWPLGMIGPAEILWQSSSTPTARKQVWLRFHPAMFPEAWEAIRSSVSGWYEQGSSTTQGKGEQGTIVMKDLRGDICAFELMGPRSASVLRGVMGLVKDQTLRSDTAAVEPDLDAMAVDDEEILQGEQEDDPDEVSDSAKKRFWTGMKHVQSSGQLSEGMVVGLRVHDPRLRFPPRNARPAQAPEEDQSPPDPVFPSPELAESALWDEAVRGSLLKPRYRKADLDRRRNELGIPGLRLQPRKDDDRVPILLVQKSLICETTNEDQAAAVHGYTIFLPAGWAMPFWQSFVFTGSTISGLEERDTQYLEAGLPSFPKCFPQTRSGEGWRTEELTERKRRWDRRPPGKRMEYGVVGVDKPWDIEWASSLGLSEEAKPWLVPNWLLQGFQASLRPDKEDRKTMFWRIADKCRQALRIEPFPISKRNYAWQAALIHVTISTVGRGSPKDFAEIHIIGECELSSLKDNKDVGELQAPKPETGSVRLGHVLAGTQSLARGRGHGIAAVALHRFLELPVTKLGKTHGRLVKIRNPEGLIWRYALVHILK